MMTAMLLQPLPVAARLYVDRNDIRFHNVTPDLVEIQVVVSNRSDQCSLPTTMHLQAAPLGAFVPWQPLADVLVPEIDPWGQVTVRTQVASPRPIPLGDPVDVTPQDLLAAIGAGTGRRTLRTRAATPGWLPWRRRQPDSTTTASDPSPLPSDPNALLSRANPHWAGNINVFIGDCAAERHVAQALRIYPGRTNVALFFVGAGTDAYAFELFVSDSTWDVTLHSAALSARLFRDPEEGDEFPLGEWIDGWNLRMLFLAMRLPPGSSEGTVEVQVHQFSTDKLAVVEFSLDPAAAGPGCYAY